MAALNKIDLPAAEPDRVAAEIEHVLGLPADEILHISAKTGEGVPELLDAVVEPRPAAQGRPRRPPPGADLRLLLRRLPRGRLGGAGHERHADAPGAELRFVQAGGQPRRRGDRRPPPRPHAGGQPRTGRGRLPHRRHQGRRPGPGRARPSPWPPGPAEALAGYRDPKPMVFCGLYPVEGDDFADLREALEKLRLNDSSFTYAPGDVGGARLRVPVRVPRPAPHGDHPGAPGARVRPVAGGHGTQRRVPGPH